MSRGLRSRLVTAAGLLVAPVTYTLGAQFVGGTLERGVIKRGPARPQASLTFDDGPDLHHTPRILEALERANVRAAFVVDRAHAGAIVVLHDRGGHPSTPAETCAALPGMIAGLRDRGFEVVPLRELLAPAP